MTNFVEAGHLGGYVIGGDEATYYPELWKWLVNEYNAHSILDVGCGDGVALEFFAKQNCLVHGIDGVTQEKRYIDTHDYTQGPWKPTGDLATIDWDLIWCCEFVEHVEEQYIPNFMDTFKRGHTILITHAFPGQDGYHHVNCQYPHYWVSKMRDIGYKLDADLTLKTRDLAAHNESPWNHYVRSGLAFIRSE